MNISYVHRCGQVTDDPIEGSGQHGTVAYIHRSSHVTDEYMYTCGLYSLMTWLHQRMYVGRGYVAQPMYICRLSDKYIIYRFRNRPFPFSRCSLFRLRH
jgi:hypothetical protein